MHFFLLLLLLAFVARRDVCALLFHSALRLPRTDTIVTTLMLGWRERLASAFAPGITSTNTQYLYFELEPLLHSEKCRFLFIAAAFSLFREKFKCRARREKMEIQLVF